MCPLVGMVMGSLIYFVWRKNETPWKRQVALACAVLAVFSLLYFGYAVAVDSGWFR